MKNRQKAAVAAVALGAGGLLFAVTAVSASSGDDNGVDDAAEGPDRPITGADLDRASAVALEFTGEGRVTATEIEDEESYYEVEVTRDDGTEVDVQLDEEFNVVGTD